MNCVVRAHHAGLFSNLNKVVTCMRMYDWVAVDWSTGSLYGDCWNELFEPRPVSDSPCVVVDEYPFYDLTAACAGVLYQNIGWGWRDRFHACWSRLALKPEAPARAALLRGEHPDVVAVMIRSNAIQGEQLFDRMQTLDEYAAALDRLLRPGSKVLVMSSDDESLRWMCSRFDCLFDPSVHRGHRRDQPEPHLEFAQNADDAKRCLAEVLAVSQCRALVHPVSNMATAALYINPELQSVYLK
jgi:hypothetical protein